MFYKFPAPLDASLEIILDDDAVRASRWVAAGAARSAPKHGALAREVAAQLDAYRKKTLRVFDLPFGFAGSDFERAVWAAVATIPFGHRVSYGEVARAAGRPGAHRGVARAMASLAFALFVPAHRVVGADGKVKGASVTSMRLRLLTFEGGCSADRYSHRVDKPGGGAVLFEEIPR